MGEASGKCSLPQVDTPRPVVLDSDINASFVTLATVSLRHRCQPSRQAKISTRPDGPRLAALLPSDSSGALRGASAPPNVAAHLPPPNRVPSASPQTASRRRSGGTES